MNFPCNGLAGVCLLVEVFIAICPSFTLPHFSPVSVGDHLINIFVGFSFNREEENSLASHVEETRALELGFCKKDVVGRKKHVGKSWTNASFLCLLHLVENKYWECNHRPFKENN
jgi:hypothetical protein